MRYVIPTRSRHLPQQYPLWSSYRLSGQYYSAYTICNDRLYWFDDMVYLPDTGTVSALWRYRKTDHHPWRFTAWRTDADWELVATWPMLENIWFQLRKSLPEMLMMEAL